MKAISVFPGTANSVHLAKLPKPALTEIEGGRAEVEFPGWLPRLLTHPVRGLENYSELFQRLTPLEERSSLLRNRRFPMKSTGPGGAAVGGR